MRQFRNSVFSAALTLTFVAAGLTSGTAQASEVATTKMFGIGGMLGAPTGLSLKYYFTPRHGVDLGVGVGFWGGSALYVHGDYEIHFMLTQAEAFDLPLYVGVGAKLILWFADQSHAYWFDNGVHQGYLGIGLRVPVGIAFNLNAIPLDVFLEVVPGLGFFPGFGFFLDGAVGVRYYF
jgi:hypothetical protein